MARRAGDSTGRSRGYSRRAVMRGGGTAALAALGGVALHGQAVAKEGPRPAYSPAHEVDPYVPRPNPTQYDFSVEATTLDPDGQKAMPGVTVNSNFSGPEIRVHEGEQLRVLVQNRLNGHPTAIHWHGLLVPAGMDGVPDISNAPIAPGQMYVYEYPIRQRGTYWYHSHVGFQEQVGLFGAFVIEGKDDPVRADHDAVVLLSDWLHRSPEEVFAELRGTSAGVAPAATAAAMSGMKMGGGMAAMGGGTDLSDIKYPSFLLNGSAPAKPWTLAARRGERNRLRIVNAAASTYFRVALDDHPLEVTHADGIAVQPVTVYHLEAGMAREFVYAT